MPFPECMLFVQQKIILVKMCQTPDYKIKYFLLNVSVSSAT